ncbi:hypothetical protein CsSME_00044336 [Camellia sinensis var. sinensis]
MRGAASDAMGLLLKERIVLLGNQIDDFVADAIISQLLLLDAQDPSKDIRLFINSPGGWKKGGWVVGNHEAGCVQRREGELVLVTGVGGGGRVEWERIIVKVWEVRDGGKLRIP